MGSKALNQFCGDKFFALHRIEHVQKRLADVPGDIRKIFGNGFATALRRAQGGIYLACHDEHFLNALTFFYLGDIRLVLGIAETSGRAQHKNHIAHFERVAGKRIAGRHGVIKAGSVNNSDVFQRLVGKADFDGTGDAGKPAVRTDVIGKLCPNLRNVSRVLHHRRAEQLLYRSGRGLVEPVLFRLAHEKQVVFFELVERAFFCLGSELRHIRTGRFGLGALFEQLHLPRALLCRLFFEQLFVPLGCLFKLGDVRLLKKVNLHGEFFAIIQLGKRRRHGRGGLGQHIRAVKEKRIKQR